MFALIHDGRVLQLSEEKFAVHLDMVWVEAPPEVTEQYTYDGRFHAPPPRVVPDIEEPLLNGRERKQLRALLAR